MYFFGADVDRRHHDAPAAVSRLNGDGGRGLEALHSYAVPRNTHPVPGLMLVVHDHSPFHAQRLGVAAIIREGLQDGLWDPGRA